MLRSILLLATVQFLPIAALAKPTPMETYTWNGKKDSVIVLYAGAPWDKKASRMWPEWTKFATKFKGKVKLISVDISNKKTKEFSKFHELIQERGSRLPVTIWMNAKEDVLRAKSGFLTTGQLDQDTSEWVRATAPKTPGAKTQSPKS